MLENDKTVLHAQLGVMKGFLKQNPKRSKHLRTFVDKIEYECMLFNKNSPLTPVFAKATTESFEEGIYEFNLNKWVGSDLKYTESLNADVMGIGQIFMIFLFLTAMLTCSLACLIFECMYFYVMKKKLLARAPPQAIPKITIRPGPSQTSVSSQEMAPVDSND